MKFSVINLGCKVNAFETEAVARLLEEKGHTRVDFSEDPEATVIFTCAVTNTAAAKSRKMIHRARRKHPDGIVAVVGCYAQIDPQALDEADILVGSRHKPEVAEYIESFIKTGKRIVDIEDVNDLTAFEPLSLDRFEGRTRAFLKIQDGCNQFCAYCVIPYARGRERSMDPSLVISEARRLSEHHKEIVLTGIHTGRYGREYGTTLASIMERILRETPDLLRLRISSIEVTELDQPFLDLLAREPGIARHLHIPLQSGSDGLLKRMGRPYNKAQYLKKLEEIRSLVPDISISTDLMVGFPGETEEEFAETLAFLDTCRFSFLHVFPFSPRRGTRAATMKDHVKDEVKRHRTQVCLEKSVKLYDEYKQSMLGKTVEVLVEEENHGHSSEYLDVQLSRPHEQGDIVPAVIDCVNDHRVYAKEFD